MMSSTARRPERLHHFGFKFRLVDFSSCTTSTTSTIWHGVLPILLMMAMRHGEIPRLRIFAPEDAIQVLATPRNHEVIQTSSLLTVGQRSYVAWTEGESVMSWNPLRSDPRRCRDS
jgi:hypothetical protein